jgi:hypothetical protein
MTINNKTNWNKRLEALKEHVENWIERETNKIIELVQLFYDSDEM